jgi:hypothetical protein
LESDHAKIAQSGLRLIAVAMGEPKHNERYCGSLAPHVTCLTAPDAGPYAHFGLQQGGAAELMSLDVLKAGFRAARKGYVPGGAVGDARMMPGTFLIDRQGRVAYAYYSKHAGDHPYLPALLHEGERLSAGHG